ncbi:MAG: hypothetical protein MRY21_01770 [Simkaniaceae bacterium]|nr:hypothetical protein [Simkaniaceae bacterium]
MCASIGAGCSVGGEPISGAYGGSVVNGVCYDDSKSIKSFSKPVRKAALSNKPSRFERLQKRIHTLYQSRGPKGRLGIKKRKEIARLKSEISRVKQGIYKLSPRMQFLCLTYLLPSDVGRVASTCKRLNRAAYVRPIDPRLELENFVKTLFPDKTDFVSSVETSILSQISPREMIQRLEAKIFPTDIFSTGPLRRVFIQLLSTVLRKSSQESSTSTYKKLYKKIYVNIRNFPELSRVFDTTPIPHKIVARMVEQAIHREIEPGKPLVQQLSFDEVKSVLRFVYNGQRTYKTNTPERQAYHNLIKELLSFYPFEDVNTNVFRSCMFLPREDDLVFDMMPLENQLTHISNACHLVYMLKGIEMPAILTLDDLNKPDRVDRILELIYKHCSATKYATRALRLIFSHFTHKTIDPEVLVKLNEQVPFLIDSGCLEVADFLGLVGLQPRAEQVTFLLDYMSKISNKPSMKGVTALPFGAKLKELVLADDLDIETALPKLYSHFSSTGLINISTQYSQGLSMHNMFPPEFSFKKTPQGFSLPPEVCAHLVNRANPIEREQILKALIYVQRTQNIGDHYQRAIEYRNSVISKITLEESEIELLIEQALEHRVRIDLSASNTITACFERLGVESKERLALRIRKAYTTDLINPYLPSPISSYINSVKT